MSCKIVQNPVDVLIVAEVGPDTEGIQVSRPEGIVGEQAVNIGSVHTAISRDRTINLISG